MTFLSQLVCWTLRLYPLGYQIIFSFCVLLFSLPFWWVFQLMPSLLGPEPSCFPGVWDNVLATPSSPFPVPHYYTLLFNFLTVRASPQSSPKPAPTSFPSSPPLFLTSPSHPLPPVVIWFLRAQISRQCCDLQWVLLFYKVELVL